jgi:hypothetical protein
VIVGGESGTGARGFDLSWARSVVEQCRAASVACFVKQVGSRPFDHVVFDDQARFIGGSEAPRLRNRKGGDPQEWPAELRVREFPR